MINNKDLKIRGMTLAEVMVAVAIFAIIMMAVGTFSANIFSYNSSISSSFSAAQNSQTILRTMLKELREIAPGANGAYPLVRTGSTTLSFFSDVNNDTKTEQITYSLIGTTLYRAVINPTGSPPTYPIANQSTTTLITNVMNGNALPSFQYYDTNYTGTSSPLVQPVSAYAVRLIKINQQIDVDPIHSPLPILYSVQASLRNLKTNL
ncbi:MAG: prepilin-type N-terminal cleavage/methylation domain-containing protein [Candidatus Paceibacterota bacterium]|jgi:prepilin-type N-terminal cleavage/methylation domain-containing protein